MDPSIISEITGTDCHIAAYASSAAHTIPLRKASISASPTLLPTASLVSPLGGFLCLAPVQSDSFPSTPARASPLNSPSAVTAVAEQPLLPIAPRRRPSETLRFLKLGPVFFGGSPGVGDYADE